MKALVDVRVATPACLAEQSSADHRPKRAIRRCFTLIAEALREIFDESAYRRFLDRNQLDSSRTAYAAFLREIGTARARRPKCC